MKKTKSALWLIVVLLGLLAVYCVSLYAPQQTEPMQIAPAGNVKPTERHYVGADSCKTCHAVEHQQWQESDHFKAMQAPSESTVLGDFSGTQVDFHGISNRFYKVDDTYFIDTNDAYGQAASFEVKHTFGFYPLQQYLVELEKGRVQALNVAWDSRGAEEGGQRWFHLQPAENISAEHPFYWTNHFQNWNSRCADCHSTNLQRNYNAGDNSFNTTFSEINVACEACHGAGSQHVELAQSSGIDGDTGFATQASPALKWQFSANHDIAQPLSEIGSEKNDDTLNMCSACHALRSQLIKSPSDERFHQANRLQLLNETSYFADGQAQEEAFVTGSFLQSKMHHKGVTCSNCHNPHTGKTRIQGNGLCAQCHKPQVYDTEEHHHHEVSSPGSECVNCHMPERTVMQVDDRRDHSFTIPRPDLSLALGVPNACTQCHADKTDTWAQQQTSEWGVSSSTDHWAHLIRRLSQNDVLATRSAVHAVLNTGLPDMVRASLLEHLAPMPSRVSADLARKSLYDKSPLVRRGAVAALQGQAADVRWQTLSPFFDDPNRSVRIEIAKTLSDVFVQLLPEQQAALSPLIVEYREMLLVSADAVGTQLNLANLEMRLGQLDAAEQAYRQALTIEPSFVPALLSLSDFYRSLERETEEKQLLEKALKIAPDSAGAQHSMGLYYVRQKQYDVALEHLKLAIEQSGASPYYAYVYAVALENQGQLKTAIASLQAADQRWPNQYELLLTLILYLEKSGKPDQVLPYLSTLSAIAPSAPAVQQLLSKY